MTMDTLTIGQLAQDAQVKVDTVRYYERRGLIPKPPRGKSGYRQYSPDDVARIQFIRRAQELGFTLNEIGELLALRKTKLKLRSRTLQTESKRSRE